MNKFFVLFCFFVVFSCFAGAEDLNASVVRSLPSFVYSGDSFTVYLDVSPASTESMSVYVYENYPSSWGVSDVSNEGNASGDGIEWFFESLDAPESVSYKVKIPSGAEFGRYVFDGSYTVVEGLSGEVGGDLKLEVLNETDPTSSDSYGDRVFSILIPMDIRAGTPTTVFLSDKELEEVVGDVAMVIYQYGGAESSNELVTSGRTNSVGAYTFTLPNPGVYVLYARDPDYKELRKLVTVEGVVTTTTTRTTTTTSISTTTLSVTSTSEPTTTTLLEDTTTTLEETTIIPKSVSTTVPTLAGASLSAAENEAKEQVSASITPVDYLLIIILVLLCGVLATVLLRKKRNGQKPGEEVKGETKSESVEEKKDEQQSA